MSKRTYHTYSPEDKLRIVKLVEENNKDFEKVGKMLGITASGIKGIYYKNRKISKININRNKRVGGVQTLNHNKPNKDIIEEARKNADNILKVVESTYTYDGSFKDFKRAAGILNMNEKYLKHIYTALKRERIV